jgi:hypothetical protein
MIIFIFIFTRIEFTFLFKVNCLDSRWKLIFSDEFNGNSLDTTKWTVCFPPFFLYFFLFCILFIFIPFLSNYLLGKRSSRIWVRMVQARSGVCFRRQSDPHIHYCQPCKLLFLSLSRSSASPPLSSLSRL